MINAAWLIPAFIAGSWLGLIVAALMVTSSEADKHDEAGKRH